VWHVRVLGFRLFFLHLDDRFVKFIFIVLWICLRVRIIEDSVEL
jgi:hypothetical protein